MSHYHGLNSSDRSAPKARSSRRSSQTQVKEDKTTTHNGVLSPIPDEEEDVLTLPNGTQAKPSPFNKTRLRLDAFLGEWLTPDYYESITPPPDSVLMIASAKVELLRRGDIVDTFENSLSAVSNKGYFPGGWSSRTSGSANDADNQESKFSRKFFTTPQYDKTNDQGSSESRSQSKFASEAKSSTRPVPGVYIPPVPRYAISPMDSIPAGYVTHAREACVNVDYQWDTIHPPQDWGNGGDYGEEWSSMHKRFRKGLHHVLNWYQLHHESAHQIGGHQRTLHPNTTENEDENTDTVLVLVTHGAGCNALIGALTNQPVLIDVGMASLTMAVYNEEPASSNGEPNASTARRRPSHEYSPSSEYNVLLTASTEHLRAGSHPLSLSALQQPKHSRASSQPQPRIPFHRYRINSASSITASPIDIIPGPFKFPEALDTSGTDGVQQDMGTLHIRSNSGLWNKPDQEAILGTFSRRAASLSAKKENGLTKGRVDNSAIMSIDEEITDDAKTDQRRPSLGLWGAGAAVSEVKGRELGFKRRWTVNER